MFCKRIVWNGKDVRNKKEEKKVPIISSHTFILESLYYLEEIIILH